MFICFLFVWFGTLQLNDPDPLVWASVYWLGALGVWFRAKLAPKLLWAIAAMCVLSAMGVGLWGTGVAKMGPGPLASEVAREVLGLLLVGAAMAWYAWRPVQARPPDSRLVRALGVGLWAWAGFGVCSTLYLWGITGSLFETTLQGAWHRADDATHGPRWMEHQCGCEPDGFVIEGGEVTMKGGCAGGPCCGRDVSDEELKVVGDQVAISFVQRSRNAAGERDNADQTTRLSLRFEPITGRLLGQEGAIYVQGVAERWSWTGGGHLTWWCVGGPERP